MAAFLGWLFYFMDMTLSFLVFPPTHASVLQPLVTKCLNKWGGRLYLLLCFGIATVNMYTNRFSGVQKFHYKFTISGWNLKIPFLHLYFSTLDLIPWVISWVMFLTREGGN